jgi:hypothetical protein
VRGSDEVRRQTQRDELALAAFYALENVAEQLDNPYRDMMPIDEIILRLRSEARAYLGSPERQMVLAALVNGDIEA